MIPRTFPSTFAANGQQQMVVYSLPSITGLTAWIDYIPVKGVTTESATLENTYANGGYQVVDSLASLTGKQAWLDYIPVYEDASYTKPWSTDAGGYIPTSALAALLLDFTSGRLDPRITFSRTTNATLTNSAGLVANAPMNLLTFSEQFDNAAWTKASTSISANSTTAPDGTTTADSLIEDNTLNSHRVQQSISTATGVVHTAVVYAKKNTRSWLALYASGANVGRYFDVNNGTTGSTLVGAPTTSTITSVGSGWYRCEITFTATATTVLQIYLATADGTNTYTGDGTSSLFIWGAQLELGSTATTYNPTTVKNLLGYTENFDNAAWTKSNTSISATKVDDIYGQPFAQKLVENTAAGAHLVQQAFSAGAAPTTATCYMKAAERSIGYLRIFDNIAGAGYATYFDLATGTVLTNASGNTATITSLGNGFWRCSVTRQITGISTSHLAQAGCTTADNTLSYTGDGTSGIYIFGAQLSDSASVDPYVYQPVAAPSSVAYYGPRFDYDPVTLAPKGLLIEEQRTNLLLQSETFDSASWVKYNTTIGANAAVSPDGTVDADTFAENATTAEHYTNQQITKSGSSITYTHSAYFKNAAGTRNFGLGITDGTSGGYGAVFSTAGAVVSASFAIGSTAGWTFVSSSVVPAGNGWYRASLTVTSNTSTRLDGVCYLVNGTTTNYAGNGTSGVYLWGAQLETGSQATSYIPTVASQVTRAADSASMIGNNFARWYNVNEGTVYVDATPAISGYSPFVQFDDGTANNRILAEGGVDAHEYVAVGGIVQATIDLGATTANTSAKLAISYKANDFAGSLNAGAVGTDASGSVPTVTTARISANTSSSYSNTIKRIAYYNRRLSNTELQGITS